MAARHALRGFVVDQYKTTMLMLVSKCSRRAKLLYEKKLFEVHAPDGDLKYLYDMKAQVILQLMLFGFSVPEYLQRQELRSPTTSRLFSVIGIAKTIDKPDSRRFSIAGSICRTASLHCPVLSC